MAQDQSKKFNGRAFISTLTGISFVGMCITGIILFVVPPGRIANWTGWTIFGLTKHQWQGLHIWLSLVFMVASCIHLYYNWRPLLSYFKSKVGTARALRWEWVLSLLVCGLVSVATVADLKPFSSLLVWNEAIKHSWDDSPDRAPVPHAELLTLTELTEYADGITTETLLANLRAHGMAVDSPEQVVGDLASAHDITPDQLYRIATGQTQGGHGRGGSGGAGQGAGRGDGRGMGGGGGGRGDGGGGRGMGRMTLAQYCTDAGIETDTAIEKLRQAGLTATETTTLREIADSTNLHPSEVGTLLE